MTEVETILDEETTNTVTTTYDALGNITSKSDVGTYTYGEVHGTCTSGHAGPHAVTTVSGTKNATYCYDLNGNMVSGDGRTVTRPARGDARGRSRPSIARPRLTRAAARTGAHPSTSRP